MKIKGVKSTVSSIIARAGQRRKVPTWEIPQPILTGPQLLLERLRFLGVARANLGFGCQALLLVNVCSNFIPHSQHLKLGFVG
jgi:hypothetical protein